jgi:N-acetylglucosaminyldiphosphoundecaprenol N-acetyl-beta-D-mannosaminyltransferase
MQPELPRANILGVGVHAINMNTAMEALEAALRTGQKSYVCVTGVHGVMEAQRDRAYKSILNSSFLTTPDGMPTVWMGRMQGFASMDRVYGPDLMLKVCELSISRNFSHFIYGGKPGVAELLRKKLISRFPGLRIVGTYSPPFRPLNRREEKQLCARVARLKPDIFWVGLSTPKQERFMAEYLEKLDVRIMVGVGAAFDIHTGGIQDAPAWVKQAGLQWLHRLRQEPTRLWKRYLINNPQFVIKAGAQALGLAQYRLEAQSRAHAGHLGANGRT